MQQRNKISRAHKELFVDIENLMQEMWTPKILLPRTFQDGLEAKVIVPLLPNSVDRETNTKKKKKSQQAVTIISEQEKKKKM